MTDASASTCRLLGYTREEMLSLHIHDIDPTAAANWQAHWSSITQEGALTFETTHFSKDGEGIPVEVNATYVEHEGNKYSFVFAVDITERKKATEALRLAAERTEMPISNSSARSCAPTSWRWKLRQPARPRASSWPT